MKKNKQLGQGLGALLTPSKNNLEDFNQSSILLSKIKPNPNPVSYTHLTLPTT